MKLKIWRRWLSLAALCCSSALAQTPEVPAQSWLLIDVATKLPLASRNAEARIAPAAFAQLMTAYLSFKNLAAGQFKLEDRPPVSALAQSEGRRGATLYLDAKAPVSVETLLNGLCVLGARDAAIVLAEAGAGSSEKFVAQMNAEAQRLGMKQTRFVDPSGADDAARTSLNDLAILVAALFREFPKQMARYAQRSVSHRDIEQYNPNRLLALDATVSGLAVARVNDDNWNQIATAQRGERRVLALVSGARSESLRSQATQILLNHGFQDFDAVPIGQGDQALRRLRVWQGAQSAVKVGFGGDMSLPVPRDRAAGLRLVLEAQSPLRAPVLRGSRVGTLRVSLDGELYASIPVLALESVAQGNFFRRAWDAILLWLE